jgi:hypothetical protein
MCEAERKLTNPIKMELRMVQRYTKVISRPSLGEGEGREGVNEAERKGGKGASAELKVSGGKENRRKGGADRWPMADGIEVGKTPERPAHSIKYKICRALVVVVQKGHGDNHV